MVSALVNRWSHHCFWTTVISFEFSKNFGMSRFSCQWWDKVRYFSWNRYILQYIKPFILVLFWLVWRYHQIHNQIHNQIHHHIHHQIYHKIRPGLKIANFFINCSFIKQLQLIYLSSWPRHVFAFCAMQKDINGVLRTLIWNTNLI